MQALVVVVHRLSRSEACGIFPDRDHILVPWLAGRFLSTAPPGKSLKHKIFNCDEALFIFFFFFLPFVILVLYLKSYCQVMLKDI